MSCKHGNWPPCDECDEEDAAWNRAFAAGKDSGNEEIAEHERAYELLFKENTKLRKCVDEFQCIGVIDANGDIYPEPPVAGTQIFIKTTNAE